MKVLIVSQRFRPLIGGAESVLCELARELVRQGHAVTVLTARWELTWPAEERVDGMSLVRLPLPRVRFWGTSVYMRSLRRWLLKQGRRFDVWYVSMLKHSAWIAVGAAGRAGVPVVLRAEGSGPTGDVAWQNGAWGGRSIRRRCRRARAVVAITPHVRQELAGVGISADRICDISNGVAIPRRDNDRAGWRARLNLPAAGPLTLFMGRISSEKGLPDLVDAWRTVHSKHPKAHLAIVGSGPAEAGLRERAAGQGGILWPGATQQPQRYLRAADLFVLPSYEEAMSIALLEAMAAGLPIVASDIPGNRVLIESGRHGLLVPPRRPDLLAEAILKQLDNPHDATSMAQQARQRAIDEYSIERMSQRHLELFSRLTATEEQGKQRR